MGKSAEGGRTSRRWWVAAGVVLVLAGAGVAIPRGKPDPGKLKPPVRVVKAEISEVQVRVTEVGTVEPQVKVDVKAVLSGKVVELLVREGDRVRRGAVLARVEPDVNQARDLSQVKNAVQETEIALAEAKANYERDHRLSLQGLLSSKEIQQSVVLGAFGTIAARGNGKTLDPSRLATVEKADLARSVVATGKIQPLTKVQNKSKASGIVQRLLEHYGDRVEEGQVLAELDKELLEAGVRESRAMLAAEAAWERNKIEAEGPDLPFLRSALERARKLYADGLIAPSLLEDADKAYQMGLNNQTAARSQAAVSRAEVEKARATLERAQTDLRYATITSPMDGPRSASSSVSAAGAPLASSA